MPIGCKLQNVNKTFKNTPALNDISISFSAGRLHGLIGPEGAGKTTLLRILIDLMHPSSGTVGWLDEEKPVDFFQLRDKISYMPGSQSLYGDLSIGEHLEFFKDLYALSTSDYNAQKGRLLKLTRLDKFVARRARELSGGMYKKLGLMCALLQKPRVLLLDEPTNGVDPISRREFWNMLYDLAAERILIIISTSYMDEAERCHEVHLLEAGRHLASGEPAQLLVKEGVKNFDEFYLRRGGK